jgi:hypothetical protein
MSPERLAGVRRHGAGSPGATLHPRPRRNIGEGSEELRERHVSVVEAKRHGFDDLDSVLSVEELQVEEVEFKVVIARALGGLDFRSQLTRKLLVAFLSEEAFEGSRHGRRLVPAYVSCPARVFGNVPWQNEARGRQGTFRAVVDREAKAHPATPLPRLRPSALGRERRRRGEFGQ